MTVGGRVHPSRLSSVEPRERHIATRHGVSRFAIHNPLCYIIDNNKKDTDTERVKK